MPPQQTAHGRELADLRLPLVGGGWSRTTHAHDRATVTITPLTSLVALPPCPVCKQPILAGTLRIRRPGAVGDLAPDKYTHPACWQQTLPPLSDIREREWTIVSPDRRQELCASYARHAHSDLGNVTRVQPNSHSPPAITDDDYKEAY